LEQGTHPSRRHDSPRHPRPGAPRPRLLTAVPRAASRLPRRRAPARRPRPQGRLGRQESQERMSTPRTGPRYLAGSEGKGRRTFSSVMLHRNWKPLASDSVWRYVRC
jgi:hypothetical protein